MWRVRDRASFRALARGRRMRRGALVLTCARVGAPTDPPRVAYAVDRRVGGAVARNRVRRQLRSVVHAYADELGTGRAYLVGASPRAVDTSFSELRDTFGELLVEIARSDS